MLKFHVFKACFIS